MPLLRGNLHAHTTFSDGVMVPHRLVEEYERLDYDFLAITDHDDHVGDTYWRALDQLAPRLLLFRGVELSYSAFPQHVGKVIGDRETLYVLNHPARYRLSVEVTDTGLYRPVYHSEAIPLVKVATDDAHRLSHLGRAWIDVDAPRDRDAIIRAIRAGDFRLGFREAQP
jgi:hypothetical protein